MLLRAIHSAQVRFQDYASGIFVQPSGDSMQAQFEGFLETYMRTQLIGVKSLMFAQESFAFSTAEMSQLRIWAHQSLLHEVSKSSGVSLEQLAELTGTDPKDLAEGAAAVDPKILHFRQFMPGSNLPQHLH
jgi:hypothetical protein